MDIIYRTKSRRRNKQHLLFVQYNCCFTLRINYLVTLWISRITNRLWSRNLIYFEIIICKQKNLCNFRKQSSHTQLDTLESSGKVKFVVYFENKNSQFARAQIWNLTSLRMAVLEVSTTNIVSSDNARESFRDLEEPWFSKLEVDCFWTHDERTNELTRIYSFFFFVYACDEKN